MKDVITVIVCCLILCVFSCKKQSSSHVRQNYTLNSYSLKKIDGDSIQFISSDGSYMLLEKKLPDGLVEVIFNKTPANEKGRFLYYTLQIILDENNIEVKSIANANVKAMCHKTSDGSAYKVTYADYNGKIDTIAIDLKNISKNDLQSTDSLTHEILNITQDACIIAHMLSELNVMGWRETENMLNNLYTINKQSIYIENGCSEFAKAQIEKLIKISEKISHVVKLFSSEISAIYK